MSKFTPGPWSATQWHDEEAGACGWCISAGGYICPLNSYEGDEEEGEANARLIAAAPELLEALKNCADYLDCIPESAAGGDDDAFRIAKAARAAIQKATGEQA